MRFFLILAAMVALPVLTLLQRQYYLVNLRGPLLEKVVATLKDAEFSGIEKQNITLDHLDVTLRGWVTDPDVRQRAGERVDAMRGVRCRDEDNHLLVPAHIDLKLEGENSILTGWLHDSIILREVVQWLQQYRPGMSVDTSGIRISRHVSLLDSPLAKDGSPLSPVLSDAAHLIRIPAVLRIERKDEVIQASGALPSVELRDAVMQSIFGSDIDTKMDAGKIKAAPYVRQARFTDAHDLPAFLQSYFNSPAPELFETLDDKILVTGFATPEMDHQWRKLLTTLVEDDALMAKWRVFPSPYHFPSYRPQSRLTADELENLQCSLKSAMIRFESGVVSVGLQEIPSIIAAAEAIIAAGPEAQIIVGAFPDAVGDAKLNDEAARKRLDSVITALVAKGVQKQQMEPVVFEVMPPPDGKNSSRCLEMVVK